LGLFSLVTLFAYRQMAQSADGLRQADWHRKIRSTFSDALALIRHMSCGRKGFLCVVPGDGHGKSPTGVCGTANPRGLLCSVNG